jgi:hypothetical protein
MHPSLQQLQQILPADIPEEYLQLLSQYPAQLRDARRALDDSLDEGVVSDVELQIDPAAVLELNLEVRHDSVPDPEGNEHLWPDQFLVIGETEGGDYYCIDVLREIDGVMQYNHQAVEFEVIADSLTEFIDLLDETFGDWDED